MRLVGLCLCALLVYGLGSCTREDGPPDPPLRALVPCDPDVGADSPLACPESASPDAGDVDG